MFADVTAKNQIVRQETNRRKASAINAFGQRNHTLIYIRAQISKACSLVDFIADTPTELFQLQHLPPIQPFPRISRVVRAQNISTILFRKLYPLLFDKIIINHVYFNSLLFGKIIVNHVYFNTWQRGKQFKHRQIYYLLKQSCYV